MLVKKCTFPGCDRDHTAKGYCMTHYYQLRRRQPLTPIGTTAYRPESKKLLCVFPDCNRIQGFSEYCSGHARQKQRGQTLFPIGGEQHIGPCECCGRESKLHWDHDHETGLHRGYICMNCNTAIGKLGDNIAGLEMAISYLQKSATI